MDHVAALASMIEPSVKKRLIKSFFIILVCLGVVLQVLGAPVSFGDLNGSEDDFSSSLLMGLSVPSSDFPLSSAFSSSSALLPSISTRKHLHLYFLFHPPLLDL